MSSFETKSMKTGEIYNLLTTVVAPRPIAFVSSIDSKGNKNLSPFSFFNLFSIDPPILVFSPVRRSRNNTQKDTHNNVLEIPEVVINMVHYDMVEQVSLASSEYKNDVNEFTKSGFTEVVSDIVQPPRVKESYVAFECKVIDIHTLGNNGGSGALVICEVLKIHVQDFLINSEGNINPKKLNPISRLGANWYSKTNDDVLFEINKPTRNLGVGVNALPNHVLNSKTLTGNDLGKLGSIEKIPSQKEIQAFKKDNHFNNLFTNSTKHVKQIHEMAQVFIKKGNIKNAWIILLLENEAS